MSDTAKETLEKVVAQQRKERVVLGLTPVSKSRRVKAVSAKTTADLAKEKVYRKLRQERTNQRYNGKRVKKAKEAAEQK